MTSPLLSTAQSPGTAGEGAGAGADEPGWASGSGVPPPWVPLPEATWALPLPEMKRTLAEAVTEEIFREEFLNDLKPDLAEAIPPDLWKLHWSLMTPKRKEIAVNLIAGLKENRSWFPQHRGYLADHKPPALIVWGHNDHYMPEKSARAYLRDLPDAELHFIDGGHWLLETHLDQVALLIRDFLARIHNRR